MLKKNIVLEINTSSIRKGISEPMPGEEILKIYKQCGGEYVTIGSDAHEKEHLFADYSTAQNLIEKLGLKQVVFIKRQMKVI
jgi:histidinol-phosphatase (PHP family)